MIRKHRAQFGSLAGIAPGHFGARAVMLEVFKSETKAEASICANDAAKLVQVCRLAIGGKAHDFKFIAKLAKAKILRNGCVIHAQEWGKAIAPAMSMRFACPVPHIVL